MDPKEEALKRKKELEDANQKFDPEKKEALKRKKELEDANKKLNAGRPSTTPKKKPLTSPTKPKTKICTKCEDRIPLQLYREDQRYADGLKKICTSCEDKEKDIKKFDRPNEKKSSKNVKDSKINFEEKSKIIDDTKVDKSLVKIWRWALVAVISLVVYLNIGTEDENSEKLTAEVIENPTSEPSIKNPTTSTTTTLITSNNLSIFYDEAENVVYKSDWPVLYSLELLLTDLNVVEIMVESENLTKFTYQLSNGCSFEYVSGQKTYNKTVKKLLPSKSCYENSFSSSENTYTNSKIILEGGNNSIEIDLSNSNVILPDRGEALCCTSLTFYNLHAAIVNVVVNLEYSTTTTVPSYTEYPNCSENVTNATTVFRYYQEDVSNQFDTWAENITLFADKSLDERRSQYFEDKSFVEEKLIIASNKASLLEEPPLYSLYELYFKKVLEVQKYAEEYFDIYVLYYEEGGLTPEAASKSLESIIDKWVNAEIIFAQLEKCSSLANTSSTPTTILKDSSPPTWNGDPITITRLNPTFFDVIWGAASDDIKVDKFLVKINGLDYQTVNADIYRITVENLDPNSTYEVMIVAIDSSGNVSTDNQTVLVTTAKIKDIFEKTETFSNSPISNACGTDFTLNSEISIELIFTTTSQNFCRSYRIENIGTLFSLKGNTLHLHQFSTGYNETYEIYRINFSESETKEINYFKFRIGAISMRDTTIDVVYEDGTIEKLIVNDISVMSDYAESYQDFEHRANKPIKYIDMTFISEVYIDNFTWGYLEN